MTDSSLLDEKYDFALLGTSLPLSILSAALARAGFSVLHIDDAEHYGGPWASLTLKELAGLRDAHKGTRIEDGIVDIDISFPSNSEEIPAELEAVNRHFAISLAPTLLPCSGPTIDVLIRSKVASYCTFRLLQQTAVYSNEGRAKDAWPLRTVPSSKEDIFKDKTLSLVDKRRLMKLLQQAAPKAPTEESTSEETAESSNTASTSTIDQLKGSFYDHLTSSDGPGFSARLASDVAYGVALCASPNESASAAMHRIQRHIVSVGRYGNSAYLVGQYGGAGEMAQCFSRASAVQGGTFVLAHKIKQLVRIQGKTEEQPKEGILPRWNIALDGIDGSCQAGCVIGDTDMLHRVNPAASSSKPGGTSRQAMGILLLDRGMRINPSPTTTDAEGNAIPIPPPPETALVVFPPLDDGSDSGKIGSVWALQMGEGTFSCPKGTYLVYLCAALPQSENDLQTAEQAKFALAHARQGVLQLAAASQPEWPADQAQQHQQSTSDSVTPLFECYMVRESATSTGGEEGQRRTDERKKELEENALLPVKSSLGNLATSLDDATQQAEELYWLLCGQEGIGREKAEELRRRQRRAASAYAVGRGLGGLPESEGSQSEPTEVLDFFPVSEDTDES
ncbi:FAD/NAD(P)-binding domain-containing protein [Meira miltonrushii]|uniref:FAD/NAD(P)-binding domain-containing protein n=1 Tax=Meira miltonrushii TaxID=1280837 RepID=A0A316VEP3_9BASI|nr:FAD/NAD(P)-binding domain-containing protein [Meira miltonrushii]PWN35996.1 FAD/NAD(P)-binding domain-containing protein [Meira miltonrushii]